MLRLHRGRAMQASCSTRKIPRERPSAPAPVASPATNVIPRQSIASARSLYSLFACRLHALFYFVPITIELSNVESQTRFNLARWAELLTDPELAGLSNRVETDRHGHILMSPPTSVTHADRQGQIADLLKSLLPEGSRFTRMSCFHRRWCQSRRYRMARFGSP
jgi:hypothetical protein